MTLKEDAVTHFAGDRRFHRRYAIDLPLCFRIARGYPIARSGTGRTLNISSTGVSIDIGEIVVPLRTRIDMTVRWPNVSRKPGTVEWVVMGEVVRSERKTTVVQMIRHEFRAVSWSCVRSPGSSGQGLLAVQ
jgi:hypothetical protein